MVTSVSRNVPLNCAEFLRSKLGPWTGETPVQASSGEAWEFGAPAGLCLRAVWSGTLVVLGPEGEGGLQLSLKLTLLFSSSNTCSQKCFFLLKKKSFFINRWVCFHKHCFL